MGGLPNELIPNPHVSQTNGSQIGDHRLITSCRFVERPDHQCGDDLVVYVYNVRNSKKGGNLYKDIRFKHEPVWINGITCYTIKVKKKPRRLY